MNIRLSPWLIVLFLGAAILVAVLASKGWIDVEAFKEVLTFLSG